MLDHMVAVTNVLQIYCRKAVKMGVHMSQQITLCCMNYEDFHLPMSILLTVSWSICLDGLHKYVNKLYADKLSW